jgi:tetratricopeptide (TPR) repeat protein
MLTVETFQKLRSLLAPGGIIAQWVRLSSMEFPDFQKTMATFFAAFPEATVWSGDINPVNSWVLLLGSEKPLALDAEKVQARLKKLEQMNDMAEGRNVYSFLSFYIAGAKALVPLTENIPIHTDAHPTLAKKTIGPADEGPRSSEIFLTLVNYRAPVTERTSAGEAVKEKLVSYYKGRSTLLAGRRVAIAGVAEKETALYDKALENAPEDPHIALSYMALGMAYYRSGLYDTAAGLLEKSKKIAPDKPMIRFYLGKTYEKMGHGAKANEEFNAVREFAPDYMERVIIEPKKGAEPIR